MDSRNELKEGLNNARSQNADWEENKMEREMIEYNHTPHQEETNKV